MLKTLRQMDKSHQRVHCLLVHPEDCLPHHRYETAAARDKCQLGKALESILTPEIRMWEMPGEGFKHLLNDPFRSVE